MYGYDNFNFDYGLCGGEEMKKTILKLSHSFFIFENQKDFENVWDAILKRGYMDISFNTFAVIKPNWKTKIIQWILRV